MRTGKDSVFDWFTTILAYLDERWKIVLRFREINFRRVRGWGSNWFDVWTRDGRVGNCGDLDCSFCRCLWANVIMMPFLVAMGTKNWVPTLIHQCDGLLVVPSGLAVSLRMMCWGKIRGSMRDIYVGKETFNAMVKHTADEMLAKFEIEMTANKVFRRNLLPWGVPI